MFNTSFDEGFVSIKGLDKVKEFLESGSLALYIAKSIADDVNVRWIISESDIPLAVASTPIGYEGSVFSFIEEELICTTSGGFLDKVYLPMSSKTAFIDKVREYQLSQSDEPLLCSYVDCKSEYGEVIETFVDSKREELLKKWRALATLSGTFFEVDYEECLGITVGSYNFDGLYVSLDLWGDHYPEIFCDVTVCLPGNNLEPYFAYIDINDTPELPLFLEQNGIAEPTGIYAEGGMVSYPLYKFNEARLKELCPEGVEKYRASL